MGAEGAAQPPSFHVIFGAWVAEGLRVAPDALPVEIPSVFHPGGKEELMERLTLDQPLSPGPAQPYCWCPFPLSAARVGTGSARPREAAQSRVQQLWGCFQGPGT